MVWAFTELMVDGAEPSIIAWFSREVETLQGRADEVALHHSLFVPLRPPGDVTTAYGMAGDRYTVDADGLIRVKPDDVKPLLNAGFTEVKDERINT
jgi:hypothetical protein